MRNRAPLSMIEQVIMILAFAIAAAICLRIFVWSADVSAGTIMTDSAVADVQKIAQTLKGCGGDCGRAAELLQAQTDEKGLRLEKDGYTVYAVLETGNDLPMGSADITALAADGTELFSITAAWQEAAP